MTALKAYRLSTIRTLPLLERIIFEHAASLGMIIIKNDLATPGAAPAPQEARV